MEVVRPTGIGSTLRVTMPKLVVQGASLTCSMGNAPSQLSVLPANMVNGPSSMTAATVQDSKPNVNLMPFGMCMSPSNPQVAAATAAALGVLTPQPCVPMTMQPWSPGSTTVQIAGLAALNDSSTCQCMWGGTITITSAGQTVDEMRVPMAPTVSSCDKLASSREDARGGKCQWFFTREKSFGKRASVQPSWYRARP